MSADRSTGYVRWSRCFIPTRREGPADVDDPALALLVRAGCVRKDAAFDLTYLPLGQRVLARLESILRAELNGVGLEEVRLPVRDDPETDPLRALATLTASEIRSYRELPRAFYAFETTPPPHERRPSKARRRHSGASLRIVTLDRDDDSRTATGARLEATIMRAVDRAGLATRAIAAPISGPGGARSRALYAETASGSDRILACLGCHAASRLETASAPNPSVAAATLAMAPVLEVTTPEMKTVAAVTTHLGVLSSQLIKTLMVAVADQPMAVLIRGDHALAEAKLDVYLDGRPWRFATEDEIGRWTGGPIGFSGPVGLSGIPVIADTAIQVARNVVVGANRADLHLLNANVERDFTVTTYRDLRRVAATEPCPVCGGAMQLRTGVELGYSLGAITGPDLTPIGSYREVAGELQSIAAASHHLDLERVLTTAVAQRRDDAGIVWPASIAPFDVLVTLVTLDDPTLVAAAETLAQAVAAAGLAVLLDDREERAGVKFKESDLVGIPVRAVFGPRAWKQGEIEISSRTDGQRENVKIDRAVASIVTRGRDEDSQAAK